MLRREGWEPVLFFSNSNIAPREEYALRLESARKFAEAEGFRFVEDEYANDEWREAVRGLEGEPEGGKRCAACFRFNLMRTARFAAGEGIAAFTTSLTVSPKKNSAMVMEAGRKAAEYVGSAGRLAPPEYAGSAGRLAPPEYAGSAGRFTPPEFANSAGRLAPPEYLPFDFKKNGGFAESVKLAREYGLYRQSYCGCRMCGGATTATS